MDNNQASSRKISSWLKAGWYTILIGFFGFMTWSAIAPLDQGVPLSALMVISGDKQSVQSLKQGRILSTKVQEGQEVQAQQLLIQLDDRQIKSKLQYAQIQYVSRSAELARLLAESRQETTMTWQAPIMMLATQLNIDNHIKQQQTALLQSRNISYQNSLDTLQQDHQGLIASQSGLVQNLKSKQTEYNVLNKQLTRYQSLLKDGFTSESGHWEVERELAQVGSEIANLQGQINANKHKIIRAEANTNKFISEHKQAIDEQISKIQLEVNLLREEQKQLAIDLANTQIRAPIAGTIVGLTANRSGKIINASELLMEIVPANSALVVQAKLPITLRDKVFSQSPVTLSFVAFNQSTTPKVTGRLTKISADSLQDKNNGEYYYQVEAELTNTAKQTLKTLSIEPGMPVQLFIKTGERTLLNYLIKPLLDRFDGVFTES